MGANALAAQPSPAEPTVGDQAFLGFGVLLVEHMISEREENGLALDAVRGLYHVGMMTQNQVGAVFDQPGRLLPLGLVWPVQEFAAPVDRDDNDIR